MCNSCSIDLQKAEGFAESMVQMINQGALALMVSIGHQTGLFDALAEMKTGSSECLAKTSGLQERYVREWLYAMAAGKIVEAIPDSDLFHLPEEHAAHLCRKSGGDNIALYAQYIPVLASVEAQVISCFWQGGGVPYSSYERFHEVMAEDSSLTIVDPILDKILPIEPGLIAQLEKGIQVLDIGCGRGKAMIKLAEHFPNSKFWGVDLCLDPLTKAKEEVAQRGLTNVQFELADLTTYRPEGKFDLITAFDAIHDQARPDLVLSTVFECLTDQGIFLMQDIFGSSEVRNNLDHPFGPLLYTLSTMHCMTVSLAQGGMGLGTLWGVEKAREMIKEAGFSWIQEHKLEHDPMNCYFIIRK
ncbi:class I SAM-dependent methyltransferase [Algoriphagus confluentis]|uniref:Class I SAM-dependent methyltransferase n=1 Tax=Algoriphagus confluentis TaxID=1697556 RepID=A0ABQ6PJP7_9BACT|nr:class I SAM-dependent methyltransferase [Algoriphagus confluentis]